MRSSESAQLRRRGCRTAVIDIAGRLGTPERPEDWYLGLLSQIASQLKLKGDVRAWWTRSAEPTANLKLLAFFRREILAKAPNRFVVFLDEIDHTLNLPYTDDFFLAIRSLYNDRATEPDLRRLAFCLVGVFTPNELVKHQRTTSYNVGLTLELEDFSPIHDDLSPLSRTLAVDTSRGEALLAAVLRWTGGHPYLTASACKKVAAAKVDSPTAVDRLIENAFVTHERTHEDSDDTHFESIANFLGQRVPDRLSTVEIYHRVLRGEKVREVATPPVRALKLSGLVKPDRNALLMIRNEIYRRRCDERWAADVIRRADGLTGAGTGTGAAELLLGPNPVVEYTGDSPSRDQRWMLRSPTVFLSHAIADDAFVRELQRALGEHDQEVWVDSRQLRGGDLLWPAIAKAIDDAAAYAVVVSPAALQSKWVGMELAHALEVQKRRGGPGHFPVVALALDGTRLGVLEQFFAAEPAYVPVTNGAGGVEAAMRAVLIALGRALPTDMAADAWAAPQPPAEPVEELVLELTDLRFHEQGGVRRPSARARLVYEPAAPGLRYVDSARRGGSSRRSVRSRRARSAGTSSSTPSGRAACSGTAPRASSRSSKNGGGSCTTPRSRPRRRRTCCRPGRG